MHQNLLICASHKKQKKLSNQQGYSYLTEPQDQILVHKQQTPSRRRYRSITSLRERNIHPYLHPSKHYHSHAYNITKIVTNNIRKMRSQTLKKVKKFDGYFHKIIYGEDPDQTQHIFSMKNQSARDLRKKSIQQLKAERSTQDPDQEDYNDSLKQAFYKLKQELSIRKRMNVKQKRELTQKTSNFILRKNSFDKLFRHFQEFLYTSQKQPTQQNGLKGSLYFKLQKSINQNNFKQHKQKIFDIGNLQYILNRNDAYQMQCFRILQEQDFDDIEKVDFQLFNSLNSFQMMCLLQLFPRICKRFYSYWNGKLECLQDKIDTIKTVYI